MHPFNFASEWGNTHVFLHILESPSTKKQTVYFWQVKNHGDHHLPLGDVPFPVRKADCVQIVVFFLESLFCLKSDLGFPEIYSNLLPSVSLDNLNSIHRTLLLLCILHDSILNWKFHFYIDAEVLCNIELRCRCVWLGVKMKPHISSLRGLAWRRRRISGNRCWGKWSLFINTSPPLGAG